MQDFRIGLIPVTVFQQNCSLIWETETMRAAVIDPGGEPGKILDAINRLGLKVELILLTHGHLDHAGGAKALKGVLDQERADAGGQPVPLLGPDARDQFLLDDIEEAQKQFGMQGMRNVTPDRHLSEGETVTLGNLTFDILHVPGHTPGHIVFIEKTRRIGFTGDAVFKGSVGRTDFPYGDGPGLIAAIKEKLLPLGDDLTFIPGHGSSSTIGEERATNPFLQE